MIIHGVALGILHQVVGWLLYPVIAGLGLALLLTLWELGTALAERCVTLSRCLACRLMRANGRW